MARIANPVYASPYPTPGWGEGLGNAIGMALFGSPEVREQNARLEAIRAQSRRDTVAADYDQGRVDAQRGAPGSGLVEQFRRFFPSPQPSVPGPMTTPPIAARQPVDTAGLSPRMGEVAQAIASSQPDVGGVGVPAAPMAISAPSQADVERAAIIQGLPALLATYMTLSQGGNLGDIMSTIGGFAGSDETARRGLVASGVSPSENFALTPQRADEISARDAAEDYTQAIDVENIQSGDRRRGQDLTYKSTTRGQDIRSSDTRRGQDLTHARGLYATDMKGVRPVGSFRAIAEKVYPGIRINQTRRDPDSDLGRANPNSWHNRTDAAGDTDPIPGMTFSQYVDGYRKAGYEIIEARDEVTDPSPHSTGPHWHVVLGERTTQAKGGAGGKPPSQTAIASIRRMVDDEMRTMGVDPKNAGKSGNKFRQAALRRTSQLYRENGGDVAAAFQQAMKEAGYRGGEAAAPAQGGQPRVVRIKNDDDYARLPVGTIFIGPDGKRRRKTA